MLRIHRAIPRRRIVFSTFFQCMSFLHSQGQERRGRLLPIVGRRPQCPEKRTQSQGIGIGPRWARTDIGFLRDCLFVERASARPSRIDDAGSRYAAKRSRPFIAFVPSPTPEEASQLKADRQVSA